MGSTRLPGKALVDIGGQTALERVIRQLRKCREPLGQIIVATTSNDEDDEICREAKRLRVGWFRWYTDDVLERFAKCHALVGGDFIVRITADCPFLDPGLLDRTIELVSRRGYDYAGVKGGPDGTHAEAFTAEILRAAHRWARDPEDREHVVPWMIRNGDCGWIHAPNDGPPMTLDTPEDLERLRGYVA
jgi:spore coat polysaccharide biosynthesis protein SpsF (cytidylyltransferase family)